MSVEPLDDPKDTLHRYLRSARDALLWKLEGLSEFDIRRPLVPTGTNLLGLVKHAASVSVDYFGSVFGRPTAIELPWFADGAEPNADMWATKAESHEHIVALYEQAAAEADAAIEALALDATGYVPWWGDKGNVTLHTVLVHMIAELNRHTGHADIVRELIDGEAGHRAGVPNLPDVDADWWADYRTRLEATADSFR
jgi:uncharacterized damage-inducible protein DinB